MKKLTTKQKMIGGVIAVIAAIAGVVASPLPDKVSFAILQNNPDVLWIGNAETGDLGQWCIANQAVPGRITVVTSPVTQGQYAYRFQLNDGDTIFGTERVTLSQQCAGRYEQNGEEKYYGWSVYLPADYPANTNWSLVVQWKGIHTGSPPISLNLRNDRWMLNYRPTVNSSELHKWDAPATKGRWENFVLHVKWSADPSIGFIEFWHNGQLVVQKFYTSTMHTNGTTPVNNFVAMGLYRDASISTNVILYHDGMVVGKTYQSVTGEQPPPITSIPPTLVVTPTRTPSRIPPTRTPTATNTNIPPSLTLTFTPSVTPSILVPTHTATQTPIVVECDEPCTIIVE